MNYTAITATLALLIASIALIKTSSEPVLIVTPPAATTEKGYQPTLTPNQHLNTPNAVSDTMLTDLWEALRRAEQQLVWQNDELKSVRSELDDLKRLMPPITDAEREYAEILKDLPTDFEKRLKTDPEYAEALQKKLLDKVTNPALSETERLRSVQQLMMISGSVGTAIQTQNNPVLAEAMIQLADNSSDESTRIKALENLSFLGASDFRHSRRFINMIENDSNQYVRTLAVDAISSMIYSANLTQEQRSELIQKVSGMMNNAPEKTQTLLKERFGSVEQLKQLEKEFDSEPPIAPW